ncbi:recombinase family protein [Mycolicibacterium poriferae]|uniref:recombinase family protein n=1 Tax=Mycolicibacterium poriferae TaxID=39694 RepID=UPI0024B9832E|nr:recombinase family protein [Mycolicibacterium poriferae]
MKPSTKRTAITPRAVAYARVSTQGQADDGYGLDAQRQAIELAVSQRSWDLTAHFTDAASGKSLTGRPALGDALALLDSGEADVLVVAKLDRLSRSLVDFAAVMERSRLQGWGLVILDLGVDTSTPHGELVASIMASIAAWERRMIGVRTSEALRAAQARGVHVGRPRELPDGVVERIVALRASGQTLQSICDELADAGVPTARGGQWRPSTIRTVLLAEERLAAHRAA